MALRFIVLAVLLFLWPVKASAQAQDQGRAVVILAPGVSGAALLQAVKEPQWDRLRSESSFALVSAAVPGPDTLESAYLTIGAGRRMQWDPISPPDDRSGAGALLREPASTGAQVTVLGPPRPGTAADDPLSTTAAAYEPLPDELSAQAWAAAGLTPRHGLLIILLPREAGSEGVLRIAEAVSQKMERHRDLLIVTSPNPDPAPGGEFRHLAPLLLWGRGWGGGSARSTTTRTPGLVSNTDIAPTVLAHFGIALPPTMEGHVIRSAPLPLDTVREYERHIRATGSASVPVLIGWGAFAFGAVAWVLLLLRGTPSNRQVRCGRALLGTLIAAPLAMLLAGAASAPSGWDLAASVAAGTFAVGLAAFALSGWRPPVFSVFAGLVAVLVVDLLTGSRLLSRCLLGDFVNTGVRFYGMGNEFEGLIIGTAVLLPFWAQSLRKPESAVLRREGWLQAVALWLLTLGVVASPALGADFGGALSLSLACATGAWLGAGKRLKFRQVLFGVLLLAIVGIGVAGLDLLRPPEFRSHMGELAAQVVQSGGGRLLEVVGRKAAMNLRMATTSYSLVGLAAVAALGAICYYLFAPRVRRVVAAKPLPRAGSIAALVGAGAALALNDSGIVAGGLAVGCVLLMWLDALLEDALVGKVDCPGAARLGSA